MSTASAESSFAHHDDEPHAGSLAGRLNWLRAGVLGANDGIVSVAAIVVGVAGASTSTPVILAAGSAALVGGAISMALGEYVSVSSQRDSQHALIEKERAELHDDPAGELTELAGMYQNQGLSAETAKQVALELTQRDALKAHLAMELNIDENDVVSPWSAAGASALSFLLGGILPLLAILLPPEPARIPITFIVVIIALAATGITGAILGGARVVRATLRVVIGGVLALAATFLIGSLLGTSGIA
ncbi:VIT1/CCC1 transporter family protein [Subtercola vilae]|uniref:VIT family protein n=1 Tax=Subtercola vilae TaxID=2056433 RepID=A0A4T2C825_9MICO|nr:VIT family protein [Subtercola vilae]TIH40615.1 VIT family protein [Subtercola vilae]